MINVKKRVINAFTLICLMIILVVSNENITKNENVSANINSGVILHTKSLIKLADIDKKENGKYTVSVPLEETEMNEDGSIEEPEFEPYEMYINSGWLNVRSTPEIRDDNRLGRLCINDIVKVIGEAEDNWVIIEYEDGIGYISSEFVQETLPELDTYNNEWTGNKLNSYDGIVKGPSGNETYYNLNMSKCIYYMNNLGYYDHYWIRSDGVKMFGNYVMCAANLKLHPKGSIVETTMGNAIVVDTGDFVNWDPTRIDICVTW